jgi:hypothetical protein
MTPDSHRPAPAPVDDLQFDRAETAGPAPTAQPAGAAPAASVPTCAACHQAITDAYFEVNGKVICPRCQQLIIAHHESGSPVARFLKAALFGIIAGAIGAAMWYVVRAVWKKGEWGIIAIVVGFLVGSAVRRGSNGRGGRGYQVLAVILTYLSICANYVPDLYRSALSGEHGAEVPKAFALAFAAVFSLAIPLMGGLENIIGMVIIAFALWEAWRINRRRPVTFNGPYRLAPGAPMPTSLSPVAVPPPPSTA